MTPGRSAHRDHADERRGVARVYTGERLLRAAEVADRLGVSVRRVWAMRAMGALPDERRIGTRGVRWLESEIDALIRTPGRDLA